MGDRIQSLVGIVVVACILAIGCSKPVLQNEQIRQSNFVHEDNLNGRTPPPNNVIESTNFFYNSDGTLSRATVYSDTTSTAHLLKEMNISYLSDRILLNTFLDTIGNVVYTITYNSKRQVTSVSLPDSSGLYISYFNDRISNIKMHPGNDEYISFIYDDNDNLLQYELKSGGFVIGRAVLEYGNELVSKDFDSRFLTKEIKFIYLGGLDLVSKLNLNYGKSTQNKLIKRTDINLLTGEVYELYNYGYTMNAKGEISKRNVRFSSDTLYYQFKY